MKRIIIIDGYNVLRQEEPYRSIINQGDYDRAAQALVDDLASFSKPNYQVTVVFDGASNPESVGAPQNVAGINVIYSPYNTSADTVIERLCREVVEAGPHIEVEVVSADAQIQWAVMGKQVIRRAPRELVLELSAGYQSFEDFAKAPQSRVFLDERISPEAAEMLRRIRDGEQ